MSSSLEHCRVQEIYSKVNQPLEALKDVVTSVVVYFAVFFETSHFLLGVGLIPNHF